MEILKETNKTKMIKAPTKRRSMTPVRLLRALEAYIKTTDLDDGDTVETLFKALSASIVAEALGSR